MRNVLFLGGSTLIRLLFGFLSFSLMARLLGPAGFGSLMVWFSTVLLVGFVVNYGLSTYALREIGAMPDRLDSVLSECVTVRVLLLGVIVLIFACATPFVGLDAAWIIGALLAAQVADALSDLLVVTLRATGKFRTEMIASSTAAVCQCGVVVLGLWWWRTPLAAAVSYAAARWLVLVIMGFNQRSVIAAFRFASFAQARARLIASVSYATDGLLQNAFGQIDSLVLIGPVGAAALGHYQAGMRLFLGAAQSSTVLGNVFIPKLARAFHAAEGYPAEALRSQARFFAVGAVLALILGCLPEALITGVFGQAYVDVVPLLPWFGVLFFAKFVAGTWGMLLTVQGLQGARAKWTLGHWFVALSLAVVLVPAHGSRGWLASLIVGNALLAAAFGFQLSRRVDSRPRWMLAASTGLLVLSVTAACRVIQVS